MSIEHDISLLESVPLFRHAGRAPLEVIAIGAEVWDVRPGEMLFSPHQPVDAGYLVIQGRFAPRGRQDHDPFGPGALLGELALFSEAARPTPLMALEPSSVMRISRNLFLKMLDAYPDVAFRLRDHIAAHLEQAMDDILKVKSRLG
jgi:CRP-like cAMP-binding protein